MLALNRTVIGRTNVRGALVLGALLAAILGIAIAISLRIYNQLDSAATVQNALVAAEQEIDEIVRIQLDQETGLRGYLASGETLFLQPYSQGNDNYDQAIANFDATSKDLGIPGIGASTKQMKALHEAWEREVALPLLKHPHDKTALTRQTLGKVLVDQLQTDTKGVHTLLNERLLYGQDQLRRRINEALFGGLASVLVFGLVCILFVGSRQQMLAVIDRERSIVETLQGAFITDVDLIPGSRIGTAYISADQDAAVGGDLYDVRRLDANRGLVVLADVSGKGIEAAVNTAFVKYSIRMLARTCEDPAEILTQFNGVFLDTVRDPNLFVVAFVGILDTSAQQLTYASAGHSGAYLRRGDRVEQLPVTGSIVGIETGTPYTSNTIALAAGDLVLLATDGLTEAHETGGALLDDSGAMALLATAPSEPQACADELVEAVRTRSGGILRDDLALLVIAIDAKAA
jgi:serine phosphatase RsbU (regulator of sigma subunit)